MYNSKYLKAREYARANWGKLIAQADAFNGSIGVSVADQLEMYCNIPTNVASDIARGVAFEKQIFNTPWEYLLTKWEGELQPPLSFLTLDKITKAWYN